MKFAITAILLLASIPCFADSLEFEHNLNASTTTIKICIERPIEGRLSATLYSDMNAGWWQARAGLAYQVNPNLKVGLDAGTDVNDNFRHGGFAWAGKNRVNALYLYSGGKSGRWHDLSISYNLTGKSTVAIVDNSSYGRGLRLGYRSNKTVSTSLTIFTNKGERIITIAPKFNF